jgi:hypothetical protein
MVLSSDCQAVLQGNLLIHVGFSGVLQIIFLMVELTNEGHAAEPFLRSHQSLSYSRISQHFMEPEGSFLCSQESSTLPYTEPGHSNHSTPSFLRSSLMLSSHLYLGLPSGLVQLSHQIPICIHLFFLLMHATCPGHLILPDLIIRIILGEEYKL